MARSSPTEQKRAPSALTAMLSITPAQTQLHVEKKATFVRLQDRNEGENEGLTQVASEVFHKLYTLILLLFPKLDVAVLAGS